MMATCFLTVSEVGNTEAHAFVCSDRIESYQLTTLRIERLQSSIVYHQRSLTNSLMTRGVEVKGQTEQNK